MSIRESAEPRRSSDTGYDAIRSSASSLVNELRDHIGANLLGYILNKSGSTINRWASGEVEVPLASEQTIRHLVQVENELGQSDGPHVFRAWLIGLNPQLDDNTPADEIREGNIRRVLTSARAFSVGG